MVLLRGIEPPTPSLPRTCSTPELQQQTFYSGVAGVPGGEARYMPSSSAGCKQIFQKTTKKFRRVFSLARHPRFCPSFKRNRLASIKGDLRLDSCRGNPKTLDDHPRILSVVLRSIRLCRPRLMIPSIATSAAPPRCALISIAAKPKPAAALMTPLPHHPLTHRQSPPATRTPPLNLSNPAGDRANEWQKTVSPWPFVCCIAVILVSGLRFAPRCARTSPHRWLPSDGI